MVLADADAAQRPRASVDEPIAEAWARLNVPDPLPLIDGLLAATAKVRGLILVTRNIADGMRTGVSILDPFSG